MQFNAEYRIRDMEKDKELCLIGIPEYLRKQEKIIKKLLRDLDVGMRNYVANFNRAKKVIFAGYARRKRKR